MYAWLSLEALRIWLEHGKGRTLIGPAGAAFAAVTVRGDHAAGYRALGRIVALGEARGYEPETSQARFRLGLLACWCEPTEDVIRTVERARQGLIAGGDLTDAGYTFYTRLYYLMDCAPSLDGCIAEVEAGLAFTRRNGGEQIGQWLASYRWLAGVLRGESSIAESEGVLTDTSINPLALFVVHVNRALAAAIFDNPAGLARHTAAAMPLLPFAAGLYPSAVARLLRGLALADQARATSLAGRGGLLSELEDMTRWLAARAVDAPDNFLHLVRLLEAERAWAAGDFHAAVLAFTPHAARPPAVSGPGIGP
jgi:hypothetical protein